MEKEKNVLPGAFFSLQKRFSMLPCYHDKANGLRKSPARGGSEL